MQLQTIPSWKRIPFLRIIIPFIGGIMIQHYSEIQSNLLFPCSLVIVLLLIAGFYLKEKLQYRFRVYSGLLINLFIMIFGMICMDYHDVRNDKAWYGSYLLNHKNVDEVENFAEDKEVVNVKEQTVIKEEYLIIRLYTELSERASTYRAEARIYGNGQRNFSGKVLIYFRKDSALPELGTGSVILIKKPLERIPSNHNPGGFDFSRYNALKGIYHQVFLTSTDYITTEINDRSFLEGLILFLQKNVLNSIRSNVRKDEQGLAEALLIGYKEDLDRELLQQYSNTGVVHVIAISGLHLALIYLIIEKTCSFFIRKKTILKAVIILAGLWIFTLLAGASPSVVRSAVMFSMIVAGETFQKRSGISNSLFASAFILLCYDPFWLWDLGFQLSYVAVLGLVLAAKPIYDIIYIRNKLLDQVWKMCSVTLAAQLFTLPILLYNFHQFPVYFLFTNFFCVPLSSLILVCEIFLCAVSFITPVAMIAGIIISWLIRIMNAAVSFFNDLPLTTIYPIQINTVQAWMITLVIGSLYFYFNNRIKGAIWISFVGILIISIEHINWKRKSANQSMVIVYNAGKHRAIDIISGNSSTFITDTILLNPKLFKQYIEPTRNFYGVTHQRILVYPVSNYLITSNNKRILLINRKKYLNDPADITVISRNSLKTEADITNNNYGDLILDGTNSVKKIVEWNSVAARVLHKPHHTSSEGAFVKSFN